MKFREIETMCLSIILVVGFVFHSVYSQLNVWPTPQNSRLTELCRKSVPINRFSRSFLCHLLPAMNIQFEWNEKNNKEHAQLHSNLMQTIIKNNQELNNNAKVFPYEPELYYTFVPDYDIPKPFELTTHVFPQKLSNQMESNAFEDINQFDSSEQMEDHILNTFDINPFIETPLITDKNIIYNLKLNESIDKRPVIQSSAPHFEDFSSDYKNDGTIKSDSQKSSFFGTNDGNQWKPLDKNKEILRQRKVLKNYRQNKRVRPNSSILLSPPKPSTHLTTTTTSAPIIAIPSYVRRKYLLDFSRNEDKVRPRKLSNNSENLTKRFPKMMKNESKAETIKDWSMKINKNISDWFSPSNKKSILQNKLQNEIISRKLNSNYTKSSVVYSIEDSFEDKSLKNNSNDENKLNFNRLEIKTISKITKNNINSELRGKPGFDYPTHNPSVFSNFTCSGPGFYADTQFGCQVYHHCEEHDYHQKFICPNGTLFNVRIQSCDYWFNVKCDRNSKKDLLIDDFKTQIEKNIKTENILRHKQTDSQIIADLKLFVENISKTKI